MTNVTIYTDGGCIGNPGPGGWAALLQAGEHEREISGRFRETTNNRMELRAAIEALNALKRPCAVELYTDSAYVRNGITQWVQAWQRNGWRTASKKPVKNQDLWQLLLDAVAKHEGGWRRDVALDEGPRRRSAQRARGRAGQWGGAQRVGCGSGGRCGVITHTPHTSRNADVARRQT